jgi:hypothetical protein
MALQLFATSVSVHPYDDGRLEVVVTGTSLAVDFSVLTDARIVFSETTRRVFFSDLAGRLWIVTVNSFQLVTVPLPADQRPGDVALLEAMSVSRMFTMPEAAGFFM